MIAISQQRVCRWPAGLVVMLLGAGGLAAQTTPPATGNSAAPTLQVPVLVLGPNKERLDEPVRASLFSVKIDSGRWAPPLSVRQEGDDPISLAILLDVQGKGANLMSAIDKEIADLAPNLLHPQDHVSIYALDCALAHSTNDAPAESETLKRGVNAALAPWKTRVSNHTSCGQTLRLRDALASLLVGLSKAPGRRVILAITDGQDDASKTSLAEIRNYAQAAGIAIFGVTYYVLPINRHFFDTGADTSMSIDGQYQSSQNFQPRDTPFATIACQWTGGMHFFTSDAFASSALTKFITTVRERYLVEFPTPLNNASGRHSIDVAVEKSDDYVRAAGIALPGAVAPAPGRRRALRDVH
jgi:hypothetical protein